MLIPSSFFHILKTRLALVILISVMVCLPGIQGQPTPHLWYTYAVDGRQIGYAQVNYQAAPEAIVKKKLRFRSVAGQSEQEEYSAVLKPDLSLRSAYLTVQTGHDSQAQDKKLLVITVADKIVIQTSQEIFTLPYQKLHLEVEDFLRALLQEKLSTSQLYQGFVLASNRQKMSAVRARYLGYNQVSIGFNRTMAHAFKVATQELKNFWAQAWLDSNGKLLGYQLGTFWVLPVPAATALQIHQDRPVLPAPVIFDLQQLSVLQLQMESSAPAQLAIPSTRYQTGAWPLVTLKAPGLPAAKDDYATIARGKSGYLQATEEIPVLHPLIAQNAQDAIGQAKEPVAAAQNIARWVYQNLGARLTPAGAELATGFGFSLDTAALATVALCRANNIPARLVAGIRYYPGKFVYETWAEVALPDWLPVSYGEVGGGACFLQILADTSWNQSRHIPALTIAITKVTKLGHSLVFADMADYWQPGSQTANDLLLGISCRKPDHWAVGGKEVMSDTVLLHSAQGQVIFLKVFALPKPLSEVVASVAKKIGQDQGIEILWQETRAFPQGDGMEIGIKSNASQMVYRAFVAEKQNKGVLVLLIVPPGELPQTEKAFRAVVASLKIVLP